MESIKFNFYQTAGGKTGIGSVTIRDTCRQAIVTKYRGPTNSRGSRIIASADAGRIVVPLNYSKSTAENHAAAAAALCAKFGWQGELVQGGMPDGKGYVFTFTETPRESEERLREASATNRAPDGATERT